MICCGGQTGQPRGINSLVYEDENCGGAFMTFTANGSEFWVWACVATVCGTFVFAIIFGELTRSKDDNG